MLKTLTLRVKVEGFGIDSSLDELLHTEGNMHQFDIPLDGSMSVNDILDVTGFVYDQLIKNKVIAKELNNCVLKLCDQETQANHEVNQNVH